MNKFEKFICLGVAVLTFLLLPLTLVLMVIENLGSDGIEVDVIDED
jgi:hypothetical protein